MRRKIKSLNIKVQATPDITPLLIILVSIIVVFSVSRYLTYMVLVAGAIPPSVFATIGDYRLHHFVYGNILITVTSFLAIGLGINKHKNLFALFYGIGLGMVLDEFMLWIGSVSELTSNKLFIPHSLTAISVVAIIIASLIMIDLYKIRISKQTLINVKKKNRKK